MDQKRIVLGIDPGTSVTGFGVLEVEKNQKTIKDIGIIDLRKIKDPYRKLKKIFENVSALIVKYGVNEFAVEAPFFGKNVQSMLKLGKSQGVAIAAALSKDIEITEYSPRKIKLAVTGNGSASKEQVAVFLKRQLGNFKDTLTQDATDALAVALCHVSGYKNLESTSNSAKSWKAFINKNPGRVQ
ncbi:MAG: crossover junction endodeoxyribonuclease RuvC [Bacteroidota bacterium]|nr:crossover junction endodeoxyribonuclease RuvC [Bacteroidota bacterium]